MPNPKVGRIVINHAAGDMLSAGEVEALNTLRGPDGNHVIVQLAAAFIREREQRAIPDEADGSESTRPWDDFKDPVVLIIDPTGCLVTTARSSTVVTGYSCTH